MEAESRIEQVYIGKESQGGGHRDKLDKTESAADSV